MLPLLTAVADFCRIMMGWISTTLADPMSFQLFINSGAQGTRLNDLLPSNFKTTIYGLIIGLVSCFSGMRTHGGTEGQAKSDCKTPQAKLRITCAKLSGR
jgi:phospholipid/cholesterol/gamma-HCH transport system permease protein